MTLVQILLEITVKLFQATTQLIFQIYRGFALFTFSAKCHGNGGHIGGQIVLGLLRVALQYGHRHHGIAELAKPL